MCSLKLLSMFKIVILCFITFSTSTINDKNDTTTIISAKEENDTRIYITRYHFLKGVIPIIFNNSDYLCYLTEEGTSQILNILMEKLKIYETVLCRNSLLNSC